MTDAPRLSICIPTYKRSACLAELLDSILTQNLAEIEVVISDDASPDDTETVARSYADRFARFTYIRQPENIGLDRNFLAVGAAATGEYIWLMGDDDRLEVGGAQRVLDALDRWQGVAGLTLGVIDYNHDMTRPTGIRETPPTQLLHGIGDVFGTLAELLGFMSAMVVRRGSWNAIAAEPATREFMKYYVQVYIVGRILQQDGASWGVVHDPCVGFRTDNDQFLSKFGWMDRLKMDVVAYDQLADALLADDPAARRRMRQRIFNVHVMARIKNAKTASGRTSGGLAVARYLYGPYHGTRGYWTKAVPALLAPDWILRTMRSAYKKFSPSSGAGRARSLTGNS